MNDDRGQEPDSGSVLGQTPLGPPASDDDVELVGQVRDLLTYVIGIQSQRLNHVEHTDSSSEAVTRARQELADAASQRRRLRASVGREQLLALRAHCVEVIRRYEHGGQ